MIFLSLARTYLDIWIYPFMHNLLNQYDAEFFITSTLGGSFKHFSGVSGRVVYTVFVR